MTQGNGKFRWCLAAATLVLFTACAPGPFPITTPSSTGIKYAKVDPGTRTQVSVLDERTSKVFNPLFTKALVFDGEPLDAPRFLANNLALELKARGLDVEAAVDGKDLPKLHLRTFKMLHSRSSGFASLYSYTYLDADLEGPGGLHNIGIFVQGDKVPVWSQKELNEPVFNQPVTIASQELSSKVANLLFHYSASDDQVTALIAKISDPASRTRYMDTYALGFTNNPAAVEKLVALTKDDDDYVRLAALSSLGTLRADATMPLLKGVYENPKSLWQEQAMAIKAIGDLGNEASKAYLGAERKRLGALPASADNSRMSQIVEMYCR